MTFCCCFGFRWVPNFGDHHNYSCLSCFDYWWCVLYTLPREWYSCIGHAPRMHTRCTFAAHILTLDMFCIHFCELSLFMPFSTYNMFLCPCNALGLYHVSSSFACHVYLILCKIVSLRCFIFCFSFIFSFILHPSCIIFYPCSYLIFFPSFLLSHLSIRDKKWESILESILFVSLFLYDSCTHS